MATILIVDDLSANRKFLVTLLRDHGHRLLEATDGSEGLAAVQAEHPDLVITDVLMPVMDGHEFVRQLRLDPTTSGIPVVFYTAPYGEREARALALSSGVSYVLTKPAEPEEVLKIVARMLSGESETGMLPDASPLPAEFGREHLRLLTDRLSEGAGDLRTANARLRALINIGLELASERDSDRLLQSVCAAVHDLFGATYVTLGILDLSNRTVQSVITCGADAANWIKTGDSVSGILGTVVTKRRTLRGDNPGGDPVRLQLPLLHPEVKSFVAAPIASLAHVYGWICLVGNEGRTFTEDDEHLVMALSGQVGRIYESGHFYAVAKKRAEELEHEIPERQQAESALRHERDRAQRYLDTPEVILLALDMEGRITLVNRYACSVLGWTADELLGRDWIETCLPARIRDALRKKFHNLVGEDLSIVENPILARSGEERLIEWRNTLLRDDAGHVVGTFSSGSDITERKHVEEKMRASIREAGDLRHIIDEHAIVAVTDARGTITVVNDKFCEVSGYSREELIGQDHRIINSGHHSKEFIRDLWTTIKRGDVWHGQFKNKAKNGTFYWVETTIAPFLNDDGTPHQYMAIRTVITERKEAELSLRLERDRAQRYLDTAEVILLALDMDARITLVNRYACSVLGWTADELVGRDWIETCLPARMQDTLRKKFHNLGVGDLSIVESPILTRSGEERLIEWRNTLLRDDEGRVSGTFSSGTDITERNQAVEAVRTAEERMRFALQSAEVGIWDLDYTTGALRWSETLEAQYGLQPGTFGGTFEAFVERIHPDDRESVLETFGKAMKSGADFSIQNRTIWPDGTVRWLSGAGRVHLGAQGEPVRGVGISQDVTERRTLEEQYQQAQKMEAIGRLAGGVAHDFNNLLTAILGYCELLLADLDPDDPRQADIAEIQKAGTRAAALTRQLLAFSRKQIIEPTLLDLNVVVADMRALLGRLIREDVKVVLDLLPELTPVKADRGQVEQIVMNLAVNARDAMPRGGTLTIETANVELDVHYAKTYLAVKPGPYVVLTVTDTGTGMTPQVRARLFEPFFTTKEPGKGTGLGLATVHGIVTQNGGSVNVYSEVGKGTSFKLYFPRADAAEIVVEAPPVSRPRAGAEMVLVVEDAEGLRELVKRLLERQGYTVLLAASADEAIQLFKRNASIDVLLTDVVMPGTSGPELTRRLVEQRPALKVIYMSGYTEEAIACHGVLNPGIAFLHKPFTAEALGRKIREVLDR